MSFLIVYKNILPKYSYVYAGVILETKGSIQESSSVNNCCFITLYYLNLAIKKSFRKRLKRLNEMPLGVLTDNIPNLIQCFNPLAYPVKQSFFVKFNICTSLQILREYISPHDFPVEQGHSVPYRDLFLKAFFDK